MLFRSEMENLQGSSNTACSIPQLRLSRCELENSSADARNPCDLSRSCCVAISTGGPSWKSSRRQQFPQKMLSCLSNSLGLSLGIVSSLFEGQDPCNWTLLRTSFGKSFLFLFFLCFCNVKFLQVTTNHRKAAAIARQVQREGEDARCAPSQGAE